MFMSVPVNASDIFRKDKNAHRVYDFGEYRSRLPRQLQPCNIFIDAMLLRAHP